jgi:hypothetical protein
VRDARPDERKSRRERREPQDLDSADGEADDDVYHDGKSEKDERDQARDVPVLRSDAVRPHGHEADVEGRRLRISDASGREALRLLGQACAHVVEAEARPLHRPVEIRYPVRWRRHVSSWLSGVAAPPSLWLLLMMSGGCSDAYPSRW